MKKNYVFTLLLILFVTVSFGQNLLTNGDLESWDDATTPTGWTKAEHITQSSTEKHGGMYSALRVGGSKTKDLAQTISGIVPGASYTLSFWYKASGDDTDARIWSVWKNGTTTVYQDSDISKDPLRGPNNGYLDNNGGVWTQHTVTVTAPAGVDALNFEVRSYDGSMVYWDDLSVVKNAQTTPSLTITSPADGTKITSTDVNVSLSVQNFTVGNGTGDGYIKYSVDSGTKMDKFDTNDIALTGLSIGNHTIEVELVKTDGTPLDTPVKKSVSFTISTINQVANIAALRAGTKGETYKLTGEVILTFMQAYRNQKYIQDATGGILIDDSTGVITTSYNQYDGITGVEGKLSEYNGVMQFKPTKDPGAASSGNNSVTPSVVTLADFVANSENYESQLIKIEDVTFTNATGVFEKKKSYEITSGGATSKFRTNFHTADYIGTNIPTGVVDLVVLAGEHKGTPQVTAISLGGILGTTRNEIPGFGLYPNPVKGNTFTLKTASVAAKNINIYNVLGKQVLTATAQGNIATVNVAALNTGIYIVKVEENGKIATKKLVIK